MMDWFNVCFSGFSSAQLLTLVLCAVLIGVNKTGIPGLGTLPVALLTLAFPAKLSTGLQLMMLCSADLMAIAYYRRSANWNLMLKLFPFALAGMAIGHFTLEFLNDSHLRRMIGIIILAMAVLNLVRTRYLKEKSVPDSIWFAFLVGAAAGFTTLIANAAGPVMAIYLLAMRLPKEEYMGTCAWFFMIINYIKLPIFLWEGRITMPAFRADLPMLPFLALGAVLGILFVRKAPQKLFEQIILVFIVISAARLLL